MLRTDPSIVAVTVTLTVRAVAFGVSGPKRKARPTEDFEMRCGRPLPVTITSTSCGPPDKSTASRTWQVTPAANEPQDIFATPGNVALGATVTLNVSDDPLVATKARRGRDTRGTFKVSSI